MLRMMDSRSKALRIVGRESTAKPRPPRCIEAQSGSFPIRGERARGPHRYASNFPAASLDRSPLTVNSLMVFSPSRNPFFLYRGWYVGAVRPGMVRPCLDRRCHPFVPYPPYFPCRPFVLYRPDAPDHPDVRHHPVALYHPSVPVLRSALARPVVQPAQAVPAPQVAPAVARRFGSRQKLTGPKLKLSLAMFSSNPPL